jgi:hypothetical protein
MSDNDIQIDWQAELLGAVVNPHTVLMGGETMTEKDADEIRKMILTGALGDDHKFYESKRERRGTVHAVIRNAYHQLNHDREVAATTVVIETPEQERLRKATKSAFGKTPTLAARGELVKVLTEQGRTPREAQAELERIAKAFGADLHNLQPGRTPKEFKKPRDPLADDGDDDGDSGKGKERKPSNGPDAKLEALADEACVSLKAQGELYKRDPIKCAVLLAERGLALGQLATVRRTGSPDHSKNPWANGDVAEQQRITKVNPKMAASLMLAARKK